VKRDATFTIELFLILVLLAIAAAAVAVAVVLCHGFSARDKPSAITTRLWAAS